MAVILLTTILMSKGKTARYRGFLPQGMYNEQEEQFGEEHDTDRVQQPGRGAVARIPSWTKGRAEVRQRRVPSKEQLNRLLPPSFTCDSAWT